MLWNEHSNLEGLHAPFSASQYHWVNYDADKLIRTYRNNKKKEEGTRLHNLASLLIKDRIRVEDIDKAFNRFVNDAIDFDMQSEQVLYFSDYFFGTADAIKYDTRKKELYIFDLKTGSTKPSFIQLDIYAAFFCLEYGIKPEKLYIQTRLYQFDKCKVNEPDPEAIRDLMDLIIEFDHILREENKS